MICARVNTERRRERIESQNMHRSINETTRWIGSSDQVVTFDRALDFASRAFVTVCLTVCFV